MIKENKYGDRPCGRSFVNLVNNKLLDEKTEKEALNIICEFDNCLKEIDNKNLKNRIRAKNVWIKFVGIVRDFGTHNTIVIEGKKTVRVERMLDCIIYFKFMEFIYE